MKHIHNTCRLCTAALSLALLTLLPACGRREKPVFPVEGQVFFQKKPAGEALVILTPKENAELEQWPTGYPRGTVGEDGSFKISTYRNDDGAPAGVYTVTLMWLVQDERDEETRFDKLQGRYADPATSKIHVEIKSDRQGNKLDPIHLD